jgi:hypothetical protein
MSEKYIDNNINYTENMKNDTNNNSLLSSIPNITNIPITAPQYTYHNPYPYYPSSSMGHNPYGGHGGYGGHSGHSGSSLFLYLRKLYDFFNVKAHISKVFGTELLLVISLLTIFKVWLKKNLPSANNYIFREKLASFNITYTQYIANFHGVGTSDSDSLVYKSILHYVISKNILCIKYLTDSCGAINYFSKNDEIRVCSHIYFDTKNSPNGTYTTYEIELYTFNSNQRMLDNFIRKCIKIYLKDLQSKNIYIKKNKNHRYYKYNGFNNVNNVATFEEHIFNSNKNFSNMFFKNKDNFLKKIKLFNNNKKWYIDRGLPYTLGIILWGPPGTGKTSCIKALANYTNRNIIDVSLAKVKTYKELNAIFNSPKINNNEIHQNKRIYIFEDIDCIIDVVKERSYAPHNPHATNNPHNQHNQHNPHNQHNQHTNPPTAHSVPNMMDNIISLSNLAKLVNKPGEMHNNSNMHMGIQNLDADSKVTLDVLLNLFDGMLEADGRIVCVTTNRYHLLDKAFIRPGRFDCHLCLDNADAVTISEICVHFTKKNLSKYFLGSIKKYETFNGKYVWSPARIIQICTELLDQSDFETNFVTYLQKNYNKEIKLLNLDNE